MPSSPSQQVRDNVRRMERYRTDPVFRTKLSVQRKLRYRTSTKTFISCMVGRAKKRAIQLGIEFNLDFSDILVPEVCPILGIPLVIGDGGSCYNSPSLDRVNPKLGYVKGNVQVISHRANTLKSNATLEELKVIVAWMERN